MSEVNFFEGTTLDPSANGSSDAAIAPDNPFSGTTLDATPDPVKNSAGSTPVAAIPEPEPEPEPDYANMPWSEVGSRAIENIGPSTARQVGNIWAAIKHPVATGNAILTLGKGVAGKTGDAIVRGLGGEPIKWDDKENSIAALDNVLGHYEDTYGSSAGFKKTLATDPASVGMDIASIAPVVGPAVKMVGVGDKAANLAAKTVSLVDPVQTSLKAARIVTKAPSKVIGAVSPLVQGASTGVPSNLLRIARDTGLSTDKAGRGVFRQFLSGQGDFGQIVDTADQAVSELRNNAISNYLSDMSNYRKSTQQLPMDSLISQSGAPIGPLQDLMDYVNQSGNTTRFVHGKDLAQNAYDQILDTATSSHPSARTFIDLDNLKRSLQDLAEHTSDFSLKGKIGAVANHVKQMVISIAPEYERTMSEFQKWSSELRDFRSTLGASNNKLAETTKLAKLLKASRTGKGRDLLADLAATNAGKYLPNMLAGVAASHVTPPLLRGVMETGLIGAGVYLANPNAWPALGLAAANTSPRLAAESQYLAGVLRRNVGDPANKGIDAVTTQPITYGAAALGEAENREKRAQGGAVDHEKEADALVHAACIAKAKIAKTTKPLLKTPDEHIVKALSLANKYT